MSWAGHYLEACAPDSYFVGLGLAAMGSAVAGAISGKLAAPGRRAVALVGDGAFAMNGVEVHTAVEEGLDVVWVVLNDSGYGMIGHGERLLLGADLGACEFRTPVDAAGLARALGARGVRVDSRTALRAALAEALAGSGPCVIDARIDAAVVPPALAHRARAVRAAFGGGGRP
jgi:acetolactate synthase-1/2/3 large subunit